MRLIRIKETETCPLFCCILEKMQSIQSPMDYRCFHSIRFPHTNEDTVVSYGGYYTLILASGDHLPITPKNYGCNRIGESRFVLYRNIIISCTGNFNEPVEAVVQGNVLAVWRCESEGLRNYEICLQITGEGYDPRSLSLGMDSRKD